MSLQTAYKNMMSEYSNHDADWVQFVKDHYNYIMENAEMIALDIHVHHTTRYRLEDYLNRFGIDPSLTWIVIYINQLKSNLSFIELNQLLIPNERSIRYLREQYMTVRSNFKNARK